MSTDDIFFNEKAAHSGRIGEVILNRPQALNALSLDMCQRFSEQLRQWKDNNDITAVIVKGASDRAFCAGGDIKKLYENRDKDPTSLSRFFLHEYRLNALIHHFPKPYFALLHHITMGGGAGVSIHGNYRIATENLLFAMPETKIGFFPDIGALYFLNQCPGYTGLYLALTGNTIGPAAAHELGLVTHTITQSKLDAFESALCNAKNISAQLMNPFVVDMDNSKLTAHIKTINDCFSADSVNDILLRLENQNNWSHDIATQLKARCPTSLKITFAAYHRAQQMTFDDIMQMNFDLCQQFLAEPDFFEGVRAAIIDKDQSPQWQSEISDDEMKKYFKYKDLNLL